MKKYLVLLSTSLSASNALALGSEAREAMAAASARSGESGASFAAWSNSGATIADASLQLEKLEASSRANQW